MQKDGHPNVPGKTLRISIGNIDLFDHYSLVLFSRKKKFYWVKKLFKLKQTWYGVSPVYLGS